MNLWEREWKINSDPEDVFLEAGSKAFTIKKNGLNGGSTFDVYFNGDGMPAEWNDCSLVARGTEPFKLIGDPLPIFDESAATRNKYNEAIKAALLTTTTSTRRLEGELDTGVGRKAVFLFLARNAVASINTSGIVTLQDLLVLKRTTLFSWSPAIGVDPATITGIPIDDGTIHGTRK